MARPLDGAAVQENALASVAVSLEPVAVPTALPSKQPRLSRITAGLTGAKVLGAATGLITGPLLARALGASGRGDLAAITVPLAVAPAVLGLGISAFAFRDLPRGRPIEEILGSLGLPTLVLGCFAVAFAVPAADFLAGGRHVVREFLVLGFLLMPMLLVGELLYACLAGLGRWRAVVACVLIPFMVPFVTIVAFYAAGDLTVAVAAAGTIAGAVLAIVPGLPVLAIRRPVFRLPLARQAVSFGTKSWLGGLAQLANGRLDQLLMITVVSPRVLGLYAVATTLSGASTLATGALAAPLMTRVAAGQTYVMADAVRISLAGTLLVDVALALVTPTLLPLLFGPEFQAAVPMAIILLAANVPLSTGIVLSWALQGDGAPLIPSIGEGIALVITVGGLIVLLKPLGGIGAAIVSLVAYSASLIFQLVMARRRIGVPMTAFLVPRRTDLQWAVGQFRSVTSRLRIAQ